MDVKLEHNYSPAEIRELLTTLIAVGLLTEAEVAAEAEHFAGLRIDFFSINDLLGPFIDKFAHYFSWERKVVDWRGFYTEVTLRLLNHSPLSQLPLRCTYALVVDQIFIRAGSHTASFSFATHPEYLQHLVTTVNELLRQHGHDVAFHEIHIDSASVFLLLTPGQYDYLLTTHTLRFLGIEYPEITAWRDTIREEDMPF